MQLEVLNTKGITTGRSVELPDEIFAGEPNDHVIYLAVKQYLAAQRQGTHKVKTRAEVKGSSKKLHKQKGTGGARKGNIRNPLYKGGGTVFGPKPHSYTFKLNKKVKDLAKIGALTYKAKDSAILVVEDFNYEAPKTKQFVELINNLKVEGKKAYFVFAGYDENVYLSMRNIPTILGSSLADINTYDIINSDVLVFVESAAKVFTEVEEAVA
ncbi:50S ribosomal protein L4 [Rhizosphaericola mali]|jgi:large subunit ribosomal protein L4|uniref:Large ribosomal subunit protein uL4 n=1 Tax=Rhizosphaericola mali TaxID=2545455 RepID=A0A5P2GA12_9BACT|nr:50S ribosomal protein L4 [Rhizosphaericola mali]QES90540.1 50S ribosomal protein L4 [Rhizosphaericola mali]